MIAGLLVAVAVWLVWHRPGSVAPTARAGRDTLRQESTDVAEVASQMAALLRSGAIPARAWQLTTAGLPDDAPGRQLRAAAQELAQAGDPTAALAGSQDPGVRAISAAWWVGERSGAPLAQVLESVAATIRDTDDASRARQAAMAGPVTTARILAVLPIVGVLLGQAIGAHPVSTLTSTGYGRVCAAVGLVAALAGWSWTSSLIRTARGGS